MLKSVDKKIDRISQDITDMKIKDVEQPHKLDALEKKYNAIDDRFKKIEDDFAAKKDINVLYEKIRAIENSPKEKIISRIDFVKKAVITGLTLLITGAVVGFGAFIWKLIIHLDAIIKVIEGIK